MKIVIDARILGSSTGRYVEGLLKGLQEIDQTNQYVVLLNDKNWERFAPKNKNFEKFLSPFPQFSLNPISDLKFAKQLYSLKPDVVHFTMTQQPLTYIGPIVTTTHDLSMLKYLRPGRYKGLVFWLAKNLYKFLMLYSHKKSKAIITDSRFSKKEILEWQRMNPDKITVTYLSAEIEQPKTQDPIAELKGKEFLLYVGTAFPHKNLKKLVDAFVVLNKKNPNLHLALASKKDKYYEELEQYVSTNNVPNVHILGWISDNELVWAYKNCRAYVFPSLNEGFGLPPLEAMTFGAPVVSSNASCLPEINGTAAHYFDPEDVDDMAQKISEVLEDKTLRQKLITAGNAQVKKYSWKKMAQETLEIYKKVSRK